MLIQTRKPFWKHPKNIQKSEKHIKNFLDNVIFSLFFVFLTLMTSYITNL